MKSSLQYRLRKLEVASAKIDRRGVLFELPANFVGDRHVIAGTCTPTEWPNMRWCTFHEVAGPGKDESEGATVVARISYAERDL
jgi:hypothetical protein